MLDQFYTNETTALECLNELKKYIQYEDYDIILEPSAGTGSFYKHLPQDKRVGIDLEPKYDGIIKCDFMAYRYEKNKKYLVVGNPPFGKISSLAIKFFNRCAKFSDVIAFIVPRTFKRTSFQNRLNLNFELIYNKDLTVIPCCFTPKMNAKCCFQIWTKTNTPREKIKYNTEHKDFTFLRLGRLDENKQPTPPLEADLALKAYGSNCGEIVRENMEQLRPKSWHWIKANIDIDILIRNFNKIDYSISQDTCRQNSIGKYELIYLYELAMSSHK